MIYSHEVEQMCKVAQGVNHRSAFLPCAASLSVESSFRIEGFFSCVSFFAENSLKAAVSTSASRPLKKTR